MFAMRRKKRNRQHIVRVVSDCEMAVPFLDRLALIKKDKSLWILKPFPHGREGKEKEGEKKEPVRVWKVMENVAHVSLSVTSMAAVQVDGSLWLWNEPDPATADNRGSFPKPEKLMRCVKTAEFGTGCLFILKQDGRLLRWKKGMVPDEIMEQVCQISIGTGHFAVVKEDGSLWMWGRNDCGQLGNGTCRSRRNPRKIMKDVKHVSLGARHSAALCKDGTLWVWGDNTFGQLGTILPGTHVRPVKILADVKDISLGYSHSGAVRKDGSLWMWGYNGKYGALGNGSMVNQRWPVCVGRDVKNVTLGGDWTAAVGENGWLFLWG